MAFRKPARKGRWSKDTAERVEHEAPVTWAELLREAVEKPGIISDAYKRFRSYSMGNSLLIVWQAAARGLELGPVAAYGKWQELGRQVKRGEKAITICMPRISKFKKVDQETGEEVETVIPRFTYRPAVFLYSQTEAIEGKEDRSDQLTRFPEDWSVEAAMSQMDVSFGPYRMVSGNCQGYFDPETRTIALNPVAAHAERTTLHELAHSILHPKGYDSSRGLCEFEAESVSMLVSHALGLGGADESRGYCQSWLRKAGADDITDQMARRILKVSQTILEAGRVSTSDVEVAA